MDITTYSHHCSHEDWNKGKVRSVTTAIHDLRIKIDYGCSSRLRKAILRELATLGWSSKVKLSYHSQISITATNGEFALCLQTGNMSRFYADLLKLQYLYQKGAVRSAIYILPMKQGAQRMGSNLAHFERFTAELDLFKEVISVPIFVIGMN
jgi:hypothetical protein